MFTLLLLWMASAIASTTLALNTPVKVVLSSTAGNVTEVIVPKGARFLVMQFLVSGGWYDATGTDAAAKTANAFPLPADSIVTWRAPGTRGAREAREAVSVYLAGVDASQVVHLYATADGES